MHPEVAEAIAQLRAGSGPIYDRWLAGRLAFTARTGLPPNT